MAGNGMAHRIVGMRRRHKGAAAAIAVAVVAVVFTLSLTGPRVCYDEVCFIEYANQCVFATYTNKISTATVHYETGNCVLNKTIVAMESYEPERVRNDFVGKGMICVFTKGDFSPLYLTSLIGLLDNCEGELKEELTYYQFY